MWREKCCRQQMNPSLCNSLGGGAQTDGMRRRGRARKRLLARAKMRKNSFNSCADLAFPEKCCSRCQRSPEINKLKNRGRTFRDLKTPCTSQKFRLNQKKKKGKRGPWNISLSRWPSKKTWTWPWNVSSACKSVGGGGAPARATDYLHTKKHLMLCTEWLICRTYFHAASAYTTSEYKRCTKAQITCPLPARQNKTQISGTSGFN